ncbi:alkaline phosphatase family protein [Brachybacterium hainanense]|uniref:Alkaline phosphatase family protein n=1 Tax=Brachybacterium hainanense TaxID=1541174 RepID=A0ABV6RGK8_9MICO
MTAASAPVPHVLIVGWDGVRDDVRRSEATPHLDSLAERGFARTVRVHPKNPTISGPVWSTMATGVYSDRHGVRDNDFTGSRYDEHPDLLTLLRAARPGASTFAAGEWPPLFTEHSGGPLFEGGYRPPLGDQAEIPGIAAIDEATTGRVAAELLTADHAAVFSYHVLPDMVGHDQGVTDLYRAAIRTCDAQLGVLLAAIEARPRRGEEEWTVIVLTDHGHRDAGHHGGDSDEEREAWIVAAGPGIDESSGDGVDHADVMAHALTTLGVAVDLDRVDGRPFGARTRPAPQE